MVVVDIETRLRTAGLRATRPRMVVAETLRTMGGHRTADEVHARLRDDAAGLPRASVYNSLAALADAGIALRADVGPGAVVYEIAAAWHHHFVCRRCGLISDVACVTGERPCLSPAEHVGLVEEAQVIFRGLCAACLEVGEHVG